MDLGLAGLFGPEGVEHLGLPVQKLREVSVIDALLSYPPLKALMPAPILALLAWPVWRICRGTWKALDREALEWRKALVESDRLDLRPAAALVITGIVLAMQEYYGGARTYEQMIQPWLMSLEAGGAHIKFAKYNEYYSFCWWVSTRVIGYVLIPLPLWKILFPKDSLLDMGFRVRGLSQHAWIYGLCLLIVLPTMLLVSRQPDFATYYPFYRNSSRSWCDLLLWEAIYFVQFFALETFFRGWLVGALRRSLGSGAIFAMAVPYCMIHFGKPYLETNGAIVAGIVLGTLAMHTRSIYSGFLVHITVAFLMDFLSLWKRSALPLTLWAPG